MSEPRKPPTERRTLARPPSARYQQPGETARPDGALGVNERNAEKSAPSASRGTAITVAVIGAAAGAAIFALLGGILSSTTGLLFAAGIVGAVIGLVLAPDRSATPVAVGLALASVVIGAIATWLIAQAEGGVLGPIDYLWETFGLLVPAEAALAAVAAAWGVRAGPLRP